MLYLAYACGLRVLELVCLPMDDLAFHPQPTIQAA